MLIENRLENLRADLMLLRQKKLLFLLSVRISKKRDIVLRSRDNKLMRISETHHSHDALQYPLMFCYGEDGYHINVFKYDETTKLALDKTVSASEFYSFRIIEREGEVCYLLRFRNLLNQFLVDMYAKIETERLNWIRNNQKTPRSDEYVHLKDALSKNDEQLSTMGKMVVLPSSFTGGPRYMHERTQDAMAYVRHYGRPDLFITFTCNPKWSEITELLSEGQQSHDRHDIVARVFNVKVKHMMKLLTVGRIFGDTRCHMYTIEWQKQLPDPELNPDLYQIIKTTMVHGPCGSFNSKSPCMVDGSDQAAFIVEDLDEVTKYQAGRYISSSEAVWRILRFPIHDRFPSVMHLAVHLENGQRVYFTEKDVIDKVLNPPKTTLMAFFELCQVDDFAKSLLYVEVPTYYVWKNNRFERRKKGKDVPGYLVKKDQVLACRALGLLEDDANWDRTLEEACVTDSPYKIRELFAIMLVFCQVGDPLKLWEKYRDNFSKDIRREVERKGEDAKLVIDIIYNKCLILLEDIIISMSVKTLSQFGLHSPSRQEGSIIMNRQYRSELAYDTKYLTKVVVESIPKLNPEQKEVYNEIVNSIISNSGQLYFLDAPGGTGKTFLINLLLAKIRSDKNIAIAVAFSGIAATLIDGGKTAHSAFKLLLNLGYSESPLCNITKQSDMAHVLRNAKLLSGMSAQWLTKKVLKLK
ncbi:hypothetical protein EVAR_37517_1 [Eumeta japonica]|uniref:ATP-dependent DNA helicase n=1 Tax=Eumeta variegata TaxID=151549 RepID=A0A4C1X9J3_EUMVA|nr:hypothetical protein EVAR_37517_1 [Eumeta japonica]